MTIICKNGLFFIADFFPLLQELNSFSNVSPNYDFVMLFCSTKYIIGRILSFLKVTEFIDADGVYSNKMSC